MADLRTQLEQVAFFSGRSRLQRGQRRRGRSSETTSGRPLIACCSPRATSENLGPSELEYSSRGTGTFPANTSRRPPPTMGSVLASVSSSRASALYGALCEAPFSAPLEAPAGAPSGVWSGESGMTTTRRLVITSQRWPNVPLAVTSLATVSTTSSLGSARARQRWATASGSGSAMGMDLPLMDERRRGPRAGPAVDGEGIPGAHAHRGAGGGYLARATGGITRGRPVGRRQRLLERAAGARPGRQQVSGRSNLGDTIAPSPDRLALHAVLMPRAGRHAHTARHPI